MELKKIEQAKLEEIESNLDSQLRIWGNKDYYPFMFVTNITNNLAAQGYDTSSPELQKIFNDYQAEVSKLPYDNYTGD